MTGPVDLPRQSEVVQALPDDVRRDYAEMGRNDLYFLAKEILGYRDMTEACHGMMAKWYSECRKLRRLLLVPRDCFKTSLFSLTGTTQRVIRDSNKTNLIVNESAENAQAMISVIKAHAESNAIFRTLYSEIIPKNPRTDVERWNQEGIIFLRQRHCPESTVDAMGMTSTITSRHYNHITWDDPISENAVQSPRVMAEAIKRMSGMLDLLVDPNHDTIDIVGTRWALHDVYSWAMIQFGEKLARLILPIVFPDGTLLFPERFNDEVIAEKRRIMSPYKFSCMLMNAPRDENLQDLQMDSIRWWRWGGADEKSVELMHNDEVVDAWPIEKLDVTVTVDLAAAEKVTSDRNAVSVCGVSPKGQAISLESFAERCKPDRVIDYLFYVQARYHPRVVGIEEVGYQATFKYSLQQRALDAGTWIRHERIRPAGRNKSHVRGLQPIMAVGRLYLHPTQHILLNELSDFPLGEHDDAADALAMQLQLWRGVLSVEHRERSREAIDRAARIAMTWGTPDAPRATRLPDGRFVPAPARDPDDDPDDWSRPRFTNWQRH